MSVERAHVQLNQIQRDRQYSLSLVTEDFCDGRGGYAPRTRGRSSVRLSANYADSSA